MITVKWEWKMAQLFENIYMNDGFMIVHTWYMFALQVLAAYYFMNYFLQNRFSRFIHGFCIFFIEAFLFRMFANYVLPKNTLISLFIAIVFWYFIPMLLFEWEGFKKNTIVFLSMHFILEISGLIGVCVADAVTNINIISIQNMSEYEHTYLIAVPICTFVLYLVYEVTICIYKIKKEKEHRGATKILLFSMYQAVIIFLFYFNCNNYSFYFAINVILISVFTFIMNVILIKYFNAESQKENMIHELEELEKARKDEYEFYLMRRAEIEKYRRLRHDYVNYLDVIGHLIKTEHEKEKAVEVIERVLRQTVV